MCQTQKNYCELWSRVSVHDHLTTSSSSHARVERVTDALSNACMGTNTCDERIMHGLEDYCYEGPRSILSEDVQSP